jgi:hypothetical protein
MRVLLPLCILASVGGIIAGSAGGCSSSNSSSCGQVDCDGSFPTPAMFAYGSCDVMDGYAKAAAVDCPGITCSSGTYYAICNGTQWVSCDCSLPTSGSQISNPNFSGVPTDSGIDSPSGDDGHFDTGIDKDGTTGVDAMDSAVDATEASTPTDAHVHEGGGG